MRSARSTWWRCISHLRRWWLAVLEEAARDPWGSGRSFGLVGRATRAQDAVVSCCALLLDAIELAAGEDAGLSLARACYDVAYQPDRPAETPSKNNVLRRGREPHTFTARVK